MVRALLLATLALSLTAWCASAEVRTNKSCSKVKAEKICSFEMRIEGEITPSTVEDVKKALADRQDMIKREGEESDWWSIHIVSPGGSVLAAMEIGRLLRQLDAPIAVDENQSCVSACVLVLAGATHRLLYGKIGIHRPYFETPKGAVSSAAVQAAYDETRDRIREYLRQMNVSDRLADDMMVVPPETVRFLSPAELSAYGLGFIDPVAKETYDLQQAQKLGITRGEYMRREAMSKAICTYVTSDNRQVLSAHCADAVLAGKRVERAPPCRTGAHTCEPWERDWNGRKMDSGDVISKDGYIISAGR